MGGTCCSAINSNVEAIESFCKNNIVEKDENMEDFDWRYQIDSTFYIPKITTELANKKILTNDDMLVFLDSFNTDCPYNQLNLIKENLAWPLCTMGVIKSSFNIMKPSKEFIFKEKIGTGILISPFIVLSVVQNFFEFRKDSFNNSTHNSDDRKLKCFEGKFFVNFNKSQGYEYEIEEVIIDDNLRNKVINSKDDLTGLCLVILKNPLGLDIGYVGLPKYFNNLTKRNLQRETRREKQSFELAGHTFYRQEKHIYVFENKIFSKKLYNIDTKKYFLSLSGISFDLLPGAPIWYQKNDKKILMALFSHTKSSDNQENINKDNIKTHKRNSSEIDHSKEKEEINIAFLIEENLADLILALRDYYTSRKMTKIKELEINEKNIHPEDLNNLVDYLSINYNDLKNLKIKNFKYDECTIEILEKSFSSFIYLKSLTLENCLLYSFLDISFKGAKGLLELDLSYNSLNLNTIISFSYNLKFLRKLRLIKCNVNDVSLDIISLNMPYIENLFIDYNDINDKGVLNMLNYLLNLKALSLKGNNLTDKVLENIDVKIPFIELIGLSENKITNMGLKRLVEARKNGMGNLDKIFLASNLFDEEGARLLKEISDYLVELDISKNNINPLLSNELTKISLKYDNNL